MGHDCWSVSCNPKEASLYQKIPDPTGLVDINFDEISSLATAEFAPSSSVFAYKSFFDHEVWFGEDPELGAEGLLGWCEEVKGGAIGKVEWRGYGGRSALCSPSVRSRLTRFTIRRARTRSTVCWHAQLRGRLTFVALPAFRVTWE
jgi:hypothetical protein